MPMSSRGAFAAVILATVCLALGSKAALGQRAAAPAPSAEQILARVAAAYASCRSYSDSGVVKDRYPGLLGHTTEKPFRTAFVRPDRFRFQFVETKSLIGGDYVYVVWRRGDKVLTWWDVKPGVEEARSLGDALSAATGVSGGSAHAIPALLSPKEVGGRNPTDLAQARLLDDATVGTAACYRVEGRYGGESTTLWIEKGGLLIRRIDRRIEIPAGSVDETTTYDPVLDGEVTEKMLAFDPPNGR
jgi:hypothetical protein